MLDGRKKFTWSRKLYNGAKFNGAQEAAFGGAKLIHLIGSMVHVLDLHHLAF
jgi:hypothetical protein